jgi:hypothetical protein
MTDVAAHTILKTRPRAGRDAFAIADGVTLYAGTLVQLEGGFLNHWDDSADKFQGILIGGKDRAKDGVIIGETDDTPDPEGYVDTSGVVLMHLDSVAGQGATTIADQGNLIYCGDSNTDSMTTVASGNTDPIGFIIRWTSTTDIDVQLFTPAEFLAQQTA